MGLELSPEIKSLMFYCLSKQVTPARDLVVQQKGLDNENPFLGLVLSVLSFLHQEVIDSKALPFKVLLILDNVPGHSESDEFNTKGIKVVYMTLSTTFLI